MVARTRYAPDRGLTARMTATMFLLGLVFVAFVAAIVFILGAVHASGALIVLAAVVIGGGLAIGSLFYSDRGSPQRWLRRYATHRIVIQGTRQRTASCDCPLEGCFTASACLETRPRCVACPRTGHGGWRPRTTRCRRAS